MRIVHARKQVFGYDNAFNNKFTLLVWILSILKWKEYGNEVVLYSDAITLNRIRKVGFDYLYDEINTDLFENGSKCEGIDFKWFWAMPKILALHYESYHLNNEVVVSDMDVVPTRDISFLWKHDLTVWSNKEYLEFRSIYPKINRLSVPRNYQFPNWFTGTAKPLNTGIIHFKNPVLASEYCDYVFDYVKNNKNLKGNTNVITMCNAEQRMIAEYARYRNLVYVTMQPQKEGLFNVNGFHTHGYKNRVRNDGGLHWHLHLLLAIKKMNKIMFVKLIMNSMFDEERKYFLEHGLICNFVPQLARYEDLIKA